MTKILTNLLLFNKYLFSKLGLSNLLSIMSLHLLIIFLLYNSIY
ncbi:hypothetical protein A1OE_1403 [Candidatus Endolissoclinum faulkneri L2]|uniref:Uncharacterized protein n=1 Tax=Candidatus Endolissoclinum faulkneri L2 TaxID=1193729 RepID=K7YPV3_9PROT|nr:hypothetical protein A1OE_1403 [Candidatus Endolissoclinum faulkneri L2]